MTRSPPSSLAAPVVVSVMLVALVGCDRSPTDFALPEECTEALALPALGVGQAVHVAGSAAALLCVGTLSDESAEYVLVVHQASGRSADSIFLHVRPEGVRAPGAEPDPSPPADLAAPVAPTLGALGAPREIHEPEIDYGQHLGLREIERRELLPLVRPAAQGEARDAPRAPGPAHRSIRADRTPSVGSLMQLNAQSSVACNDPIYVTGEVEAVSSRAIVVADTLNPPGGFTRADYQRFAATFDTLVAPLAEDAFGEAPDFSGRGRTILLFTKEVNELSSRGSSTIVLGFFFSRDLFPRQQAGPFQACPHSNESEILYLMVPDPNGYINQNTRTHEFVNRRVPSTLVHEYQHLINAGRRLHVVGTSSFIEDTWLNEGLSHIAEELLFYRVSGLEPGRDIGIDELRAAGSAVVGAMDDHQLPNVLRLRRFLESPSMNSPYDDAGILATRGAAWHFLRYALDRRGGPARDMLRPLVDGPATGVANLAGAVGNEATMHRWIADWNVALYADSRVSGIADRHRDRSWNHPTIFRALDEGSGGVRFPLEPLGLPGGGTDGSLDRRIMGGGSAFFRFGIDEGGEGSVELTVGGNPPPSSVHATLMRIR